jgi:N-carbamoyl-L-amino-acid hydrolase
MMSDVTFPGMWADLAEIGRDPRTGGYRRFAWTSDDHLLREWFTGEAASRGLDVETDRNGNLWAWWTPPGATGQAIVTGSHLDSVPDGGAFDGPLGVVSAFAAVDVMRVRDVVPTRPLAIVAFSDEEGARFAVACVGSRLMAGAMSPDRALGLKDGDGLTLADALRAAGRDPLAVGPDPQRLAGIGAFVELHVEQGRALEPLDRPLAVGRAIWPHGRWRMEFHGMADHAGTTRLEDRADPMLTYARTVLQVRAAAVEAGARATVGKVMCHPNAVNGIPSLVTGWLDARAETTASLEHLVGEIGRSAATFGEQDRTTVTISTESLTGEQRFDADLSDRVRRSLAPTLGDVPLLDTGAGHDAGVLSDAGVASTMLFVRNPSGVSHAPDERATESDCLVGVIALADVLTDLVSA